MKQQFLSKLSAALKGYRLKHGLTQEQTAEFLGISTSLYTRLENALRMPSFNLTTTICEKFQIAMDSLIPNHPTSDTAMRDFLHFRNDLKSYSTGR